jgi:hypothetical protein
MERKNKIIFSKAKRKHSLGSGVDLHFYQS